MLLNLNYTNMPMKLVYELSKELRMNSRKIALAQTLTLDKSRPRMGLKGAYGLFGSQEWWDNIEQRKSPLLFISGIISRTYVAGQDESGVDNSFELLLDDGSTHNESFYVNNEEDTILFSAGHKVEIAYILDELKELAARNAGKKYVDVVLEMMVSLSPVK